MDSKLNNLVNTERLVKNFLKLVEIKSFSGDEKEICDEIIGQLKSLNIKHKIDHIGNIYARLPSSSNKNSFQIQTQPVMFSCHMDTVSIGDRIIPVVNDGIISSDGSSILGADNKAGIASVLETVRILKEREIPHGEIELVFTVQEEKSLTGSKNFDCSILNSKIGYVVDGSMSPGSIVTQAPYKNSINFTIEGRAAHAGVNPEKGVSAIKVAASIIDKMKLFRIDKQTTANIGIISGGISSNIICPEVKMKGEVRSLDYEKLKDQIEHMQDCAIKCASSYGVKADIETKLQYSGYKISEDEAIVRYFKKACKNLRVDHGIYISGGGSDANIFNKAGVQCVVIGTGVKNPHTTSEKVSIDDLIKTTEIILNLTNVVANNDI